MNNIKNTKLIFFIAIVVILIGLSISGWYIFVKNDTANKTQDTVETVSEELNLEPPTTEEQKAGDIQKENLKTEDEIETPIQPSGLKKVTPIIISSGEFDGRFEVSARVPGVVEENGTCKLELSKDNQTFTGSKTASANVSETSCGFIGIDRSKLTSGNWVAVVTYESSKSKGSSVATTVRVE